MQVFRIPLVRHLSNSPLTLTSRGLDGEWTPPAADDVAKHSPNTDQKRTSDEMLGLRPKRALRAISVSHSSSANDGNLAAFSCAVASPNRLTLGCNHQGLKFSAIDQSDFPLRHIYQLMCVSTS